jgi:hypothetical protein
MLLGELYVLCGKLILRDEVSGLRSVGRLQGDRFAFSAARLQV